MRTIADETHSFASVTGDRMYGALKIENASDLRDQIIMNSEGKMNSNLPLGMIFQRPIVKRNLGGTIKDHPIDGLRDPLKWLTHFQTTFISPL